MTTTNANNASKLAPPAALAPAAWEKSGGLVTGYFRQSSDGVNFTVTPVYMHPTDLAHAVNSSPNEYSLTTTFPTWSGAYNSAQAVGGRGRLQGATSVAD
jgi:hypothetical protein